MGDGGEARRRRTLAPMGGGGTWLSCKCAVALELESGSLEQTAGPGGSWRRADAAPAPVEFARSTV